MSRKIIISLLLSFVVSMGAIAQSGTLKGSVSDGETGEPLPFVNVVVFLNGNQVTGTNTDFDGNYVIKPINPGAYEVMFSFVGYQQKKVTGVSVTSNKIQFLDAKLSSGVAIDEVEIIEYTVPLIDKDGGASGGTVTREDIDKLPGRSAESIATTVAGVGSTGTGGGISIRGARTNSTWVYIDGIKVRGSSALPKSAIEEVQVVTGGIPANIGDATGGVINISLRSSSRTWFGGGEIISSGLPIGEKAYGLDKFGYNLAEGVASGPILFRKDENGKKTDPLIGLFIAGNFTYQKDPRPTFGGVYRITDDARDNIISNPLRQNISSAGEINGAIYNADFLTEDDFTKVDTRMNVGSQSGNIVTKFDINTDEFTTLTLGATASGSINNSFSYARSLMNWENNDLNTSFDWRAYAKFSQRFVNEQGESSSNLSNVFYQIMVDYSQSFRSTQDANHRDDFFKYGHVGKFDVYNRNSYSYNPTSGRFLHNGWEDTLVTFEASEFNPNLAAINNQYFSLFDQDPYNPFVDGPYESLLAVQNGNALLNGQSPSSTYGLWSYVGTQGEDYYKSNNSQFRISAAGSADLGDHALQMGFEYEQRKDAFFSLAPIGLWQLGRLLANSHIKELNFNDSTITNIGTEYYVTYGRLIGENQFMFDRSLRRELGLDPDGNDLINIDGLDPDFFTLDMFSADDLLNQGSNLVNYSGYDPYGNKTSGRTSLEDFFNDQEDSFNTRPIGAYEPIYISGYIMDKFTFDDIIFNVGLRIDRFDANQSVLKDAYVIGDALTVDGAGSEYITSTFGEDVVIPDNIGDDYVVYVDALDDPNAIVGYRNGDTWYNAVGTEINDPDVLAVNEPYPAPWLVDSKAPLDNEAFKDFVPEVNIMPRISFSFNISDEAVFFAHYDILTQRPTSSNRFSPIDYLFIESRNNLISNPDLKPEKTIDYELGFQQVLTKTSSIKISAYYKEMRDMIQVRNFIGAHPRPYRAFGNLDFGTVKGFTIGYDMRRTGNIRINANYTLQFADGTGSTTETALALINAGLPNLRSINPLTYDQRHRIVANVDYRYGKGEQYDGPVINLGGKERQLFAEMGINVIANLGSGTPYTASSIPTPITGEISPSTEGSINGSRLPWQFNMDLNLDKNFSINIGKEGEENKTVNLNVYLWVGNLLNTQNINSVYRFTGVSNDDGYLAAAQYQPLINSQTNPDSFRNYYTMYTDNPFNLGLPRTLRLGLKFDF